MEERIFSGLKVWDMSWIGVGPLTARYLGDNGATVVRLDSFTRPDLLRMAPPFARGEFGLDNSMFYGDYNCSKYGIGLNLQNPLARDIAKKLAAWADVLIESFTPGAMARLGLDYENLVRDNPGLIMLSTCMQGQTGPYSGYPGFGNLMGALSGFYEITGWPDRAPSPPYGAYTDFIAQRFTTLALVAALDYRRRTGEGQHIDVSQYEAGLQYLGAELLEYEVNGHVAKRMGNRDKSMAPHGVYPCQDERWIAIAVSEDEQWQALKEAMGCPSWAEEPRFSTFKERKENEEELDRLIGQWTGQNEAERLFWRLAPHLAAGIVHDQSGLYTDPQVLYRRYFVTLEHPSMGKAPYNGAQTLLSKSCNQPTKVSPMIGEDSRFVLREFLGMSEGEVERLIGEGAVEAAG